MTGEGPGPERPARSGRIGRRAVAGLVRRVEGVTEGEFAPQDLLLDGRVDAVALLVLRCLRPLWVVGLVLGGYAAWRVGWLTPDRIVRLRTFPALLKSLLTPLAGLALALVVRWVVNWAALLLSFPVAAGHYVPLTGRVSRWRAWSDRYKLTQAYRSLRSTWAVRAVAIERGGSLGRVIGLVEYGIRVLAYTAPVVTAILLVIAA